MGRICRICGKEIKDDILEHYEKNHFSIYVANLTKIRLHPGAFAVSENSETAIRMAIEEQEKQSQKRHSTPCRINKDTIKKVSYSLEKRLTEQTYRGKSYFVCDGCSKIHKYGRIVYSDSQNFHLCYGCYKIAKKRVNLKRGNKHVYINTPM